MNTPLTNEIMENDELFDKWLWGEMYDAIKPFIKDIDAKMKEYENEVLYGTGDGEPIGILNMKGNR